MCVCGTAFRGTEWVATCVLGLRSLGRASSRGMGRGRGRRDEGKKGQRERGQTTGLVGGEGEEWRGFGVSDLCRVCEKWQKGT